MRRTTTILIALLGLFAGGLTAQESARQRAEQALPPQAFRDLVTLADRLEQAGIPSEPIFSKALEGVAKRVPPQRIVPAVRAYAGRLRQARTAFGPDAPTPLLVAGADALQRGVSPEALRSFPADRPRSPLAIVVLADLLESGVPTDRALAILRQVMTDRVREDRMLDISARVRRMIRQGVPPRDAVERVRQQLERARRDGVAPVPPGSEPTVRDRLRTTDGTR